MVSTELQRMSFADEQRPARSGALSLDDLGRVTLRASPALATALEAAVEDPTTDLAPLRFDDLARGLAFAAALAKGMPVGIVQGELLAGALELRAYLGGWVRLTLAPGDFDPDEAWEFLLSMNDAKLEAQRA